MGNIVLLRKIALEIGDSLLNSNGIGYFGKPSKDNRAFHQRCFEGHKAVGHIIKKTGFNDSRCISLACKLED